MRRSRHVLTCLGPSLSSDVLSKLFGALASEKIDVESLATLAPLRCVQIRVSSLTSHDPVRLSRTLSGAVAPWGNDLVVQTEPIHRTPKRLLFLDMDSTLVQVEGIDELAREAGVGAHVAGITRRAMNGELPFPEALRERVRLLKGLPVSALAKVWKNTPLTQGAQTLIRVFKANGGKVAVLSGGFDYFSLRLQKQLKLDAAHANQLEIQNGRLTGELLGDIVDGTRKLAHMQAIMKKERASRSEVVAIGDGANDLPMILHAGLGIAFNAKPKVREQAPCNLTQPTLADVLFLLGGVQIVDK
jgi:phosphoserine phosphatase